MESGEQLSGNWFGGDGSCKTVQQLFGFTPAETGIGDGDAMLKGHPFFPGLLAGV